MYRARTHKFHLVHPEHDHTLTTGFVASSCSCSRAARRKVKLPHLILGSCTLCVGVSVLEHLIHTLLRLLKAQKICPLAPLESSPRILKRTAFCHRSVLPGRGFTRSIRGTAIRPSFPRSSTDFPRNHGRRSGHSDGPSRVPAVPCGQQPGLLSRPHLLLWIKAAPRPAASAGQPWSQWCGRALGCDGAGSGECASSFSMAVNH